MTMQQRVTIDLHDIISIEYYCKLCKLRHSVPLGRLGKSPLACPNCNATWIKSHYGLGSAAPGQDEVQAFCSAFGDLLKMPLENATIRLELAYQLTEHTRDTDVK